MKRVVFILLSFAILSVAVHAPAQAQEDKYLREKPVRRLALVIGNADYKAATSLPGNLADAATMRGVLADAQFDVTYGTDIATRQQFLDLYLLPFLRKIGAGDFVVFYFSGHGFSYANENYLVPLEFPAGVYDTDIPDAFLSAQAVHNLLLERKPGVLLSFLDACRNAADFIKVRRREDAAPADPDLRPKSLAAFGAPPGNIIIGFASELGASADGSSVAGKLSIYTQALVKNLPARDTEFSTVRMDIRYDVRRASNTKQTPWSSESSSVEVYFKPTALTLGQERRLWEGVLKGGNRDEIERFAERHGISRYAAAARQWLADHPTRLAADFTRVSPSALELGWAKAGGIAGGQSGQTVKLRSVSGPFAFRRFAGPDDRLPQSLNATDLVLPESLTMASSRSVATDVAAIFADNGKAVVSSRVGASAAPSDDARLVADIKPGVRIDVLGYSTDANSKTWVKAALPARPDPVYIPIPDEAGTNVVDIGKPLLEIAVPAARQGLLSAIDDQVVLDALAGLRGNKSSIERVSIAVPKAADARMAALYGERARYLTQVLSEAGVSAARVSTANADDVSGDNLRMRIFGN